ncbi:MAG: alkaline phosphatase family protein [Desulfomonilaceae bacterium]
MSQKNRAAVLGLDGVPFSLLQKLFSAGVMPNLAAAAREGCFLRMETSHPCVSSVAWTSFMTGENPGVHGIFGFTDVAADRLALKLPSFDDIQCPVVWQRLPGKKSLVVNLPFTYPARPLNGILIAGFVAPIFERAVYPASLIPWLRLRNYRADVDAVQGRRDRQAFIDDLFQTLDIHASVLLELMDARPWDLFIGVLTATDRLHHFFFDACEDQNHPLHETVLSFYRKIDRVVGEFLLKAGQRARTLFLSDHGFTRLRTQVYLNHILKTLGYLRYTTPQPKGLEDVHPASRAFAMDPSRIYIPTRERFGRGAAGRHEVETVRRSLQADLESLRARDIGILEPDAGLAPSERVFAKVMVKEEVYRGPLLAMAPDLVVIPANGYDLKASLSATAATQKDIFTGMHTHDDAFLIATEPEIGTRLPRPHITDVCRLILELLD